MRAQLRKIAMRRVMLMLLASLLLVSSPVSALPRRLLCRGDRIACEKKMAARAGMNIGAYPPPSPALPGTKYSMELLRANLREKETKFAEMVTVQNALTAGLGHFNAPPQFSEEMSQLSSAVASLKAEVAAREAEIRGLAGGLQPLPAPPPSGQSWSTWSWGFFWVFILLFAGILWVLALEHLYQVHKGSIPAAKATVFSKTKELLVQVSSKTKEGVRWCKENAIPELEDNMQLALAKARRLGESVPGYKPSPPDPMRETSKKLRVMLSKSTQQLHESPEERRQETSRKLQALVSSETEDLCEEVRQEILRRMGEQS